MKYAIYVPNCWSYASVNALTRLSLEAEEAGWDGFFIWDHLLIAGDIPVIDSQIAMASIALATSADGPLQSIGSLLTPMARRRPWKVARETAALQELAEGRLVVATALGQPPEYTFASQELATPPERGAALDDGLELLRRFWTGGAFRWERSSDRPPLADGGTPRVDASPFLPVPDPIPPIWIGGCIYRDEPAAEHVAVMTTDEYVPQVPERTVKQPTRPFHRASRYQGLFPVAMPWDNSAPLTTDELRLAVRLAFGGKPPPDSYEIVAAGRTLGSDPPVVRDALGEYEAIGATWWLESPPDLADIEDARAIVTAGPPR